MMLPLPTRKTYALRDGEISALHFGRVENPLKLVFLHANGFNAQSYTEILSPLGIHAVALDMRGHGHSRHMPQPEIKNWHIFRDDVVEFFARYVPKPVVLAGHSFGAVSGMLAAPQIAEKLTGYVGFDPVTVPFSFRMFTATKLGRDMMKKRLPIAVSAGRRKMEFSNKDEAFERYQGRGAFKGISDSVLRDYLDGGMHELGSGAWRLSCDSHWEQQVFTAQWHNLFKGAAHLPDNARILFAGGRGAVSSPRTRTHLQKRQPKISVELYPELGHLFPFQNPPLATDTLRDVLNNAALVRPPK